MRVMATGARLLGRPPDTRAGRVGAPPGRHDRIAGRMAQTSPYSTRFKLIASAVLAVAISLFVVAFLTLSGNKNQGLSADNAKVVDTLIPAANTQVPQQSSVGIDLAAGWDGVLRV